MTLAFALGGCGDDAPTATSRPVLSVTTQAQNLVINPGFENGTQGWQNAKGSGRSIVKTNSHSGAYAEQITASSKSARDVSQTVSVTAGTSYDAAGWVTTSGAGGAGARIEIVWQNAAGSPLGTSVVGSLTGTVAWTRLAGQHSAPAGTTVAQIRLVLATDPDNAGTTWFDDIDLAAAPTGDVAPPTVQLTSPPSGTTVSSVITLTATAADNVAVVGVQFRADGANVGAEDTGAPYSLRFDTGSLPDGSHTFTAVARDGAGNTTVSAGSTVIVNNTTRPSVVVIVTDDQRFDLMQHMPQTSALLGAETVKFDYAFTTTPNCCPSRASFLTGLYLHNTGVLQNYLPNGGATKFDPSSTVATWLEQSGYRTGIYGKYLNNYVALSPAVPPGWSEFHVFVGHDDDEYFNYTLNHNGTTTTYGSAPQDYSTEAVAAQAVGFITSTAATSPLFLYFTPFGPHNPAKPAPADAGSASALPNWRPSSFNEADVSDKPTWVRNLAPLTPAQIATSDTFHRKQVETLRSVDRAVSDIISALQQSGRWSNTLFVFTSDNGLAWGEHRLQDRKSCAYDECVRVPMWVRAPGLLARNDASLVALIDLAPTIAEWVNVRPATRVNGQSMVGLLRNPGTPWRTELLIEELGTDSPTTDVTYQGVRTSRYLYNEIQNGESELYDLQSDPFQLTNVVNDPAYSAVVSQLKSLLATLKSS